MTRMPARSGALLLGLCLCGVAFGQEASDPDHALAALAGLGPQARALWPNLAGWLDEAPASGPVADLRARRYGPLGNPSLEARDRDAVLEAMDLLATLERVGAAEGRAVAGFRALHDWLLDGVNRGIRAEARAASEAGGGHYAPSIESAHLELRSYREVFADLPRHPTLRLGPTHAALALRLRLSSRSEGDGFLADDDLVQDLLGRAREVEELLAEARAEALELSRLEFAAGAEDEDVARVLGDALRPDRLAEVRAEVRQRIEQLSASTNARLLQVSPALAGELGAALRGAREQAERERQHTDAAGILARRCRGPYLQLIFVDGLSPDFLREAVARRDPAGRPLLPYLRRLVQRSASFERAFAVFPSATIPNTVALLTGTLPERTGVTSNITFSRASRRYLKHNGARNSRRIDDTVGARYLFEYFPERDRFTPLLPTQRGVGSAILRFPHVFAAPLQLRWPDGLFFKSMRRAWRSGRGGSGGGAFLPARCAVLYLGWFDHTAHVLPGGGDHPEAFAELRAYDRRLAQLERDRAALGLEDQTYTVLFSDHGLYSGAEGVGNRHVRLDRLLGELSLPVNQGALEKKGSETVPEDRADLRAGEALPAVVVDVTGNGYSGLYFRSGGAEGGWAAGNLAAQLEAYRCADGATRDVLAALVGLEGVAQVVVRDGDRSARVLSAAGEGRLSWTPGASGRVSDGTVVYRVLNGADPLVLGALADGQPRGLRAWIEASAEGPFPGGPAQLAGALAASPDLDVLLSAQEGYAFALRDDEPNQSDHGALLRRAMRISLLVSGPGVAPGARQTPALTVDVLPTVLELSGVDYDPAQLDGRSLVPLLRAAPRADGAGVVQALSSD